MEIRRKSLVVVLLAASLSISACGAELTTPSPAATPPSAPTEAPTLEPTEVPTEVPTEAPTEAPTATPTPAPTAAAPLSFVIRPGIWTSAISVTQAGATQNVTLTLTVQLDSTGLCWNVLRGTSIVDIGSCPTIVGGHFEGAGINGWAVVGDFTSATEASGTYAIKNGASTASGNWKAAWFTAGP
jgi:hypothetical protein